MHKGKPLQISYEVNKSTKKGNPGTLRLRNEKPLENGFENGLEVNKK
jgi:hypothetical protein